MKFIPQNWRATSWVTSLLLILTLVTLFILPLFPQDWQNRLYTVFFSAIFLCAAFSLRRKDSIFIWIAFLLILFTAISSFQATGAFRTITRVCQFIYFVMLVGGLITQISFSPVVSRLVLMDAVTAYLLLGFAFSVMVMMTETLVTGSYSGLSIGIPGQPARPDTRDALYYTFVTYTTTGYGDIVPRLPVAKSLAILISVSGQLYIAIIIALLVGKYAAARNSNSHKN